MRRVGVVGFLVGLFFVGAIVGANGGDPAVLIAVGTESPQLEEATQLLGRDVATRTVGHDGRFFFFQALDPLYLGEDHYAHQLDLQIYRGQRMLYPFLAGLGGLAPPMAVPWLMAAVQVLAYGMGSAATARIAEQHGGSPWWGLAFALNMGLLMAVLVGGAGVVALAAAMIGTALIGDRRPALAGVALAAAALSREVMILYVVGLVLYEWYQSRRVPWMLGGVPAVGFVSWYVYLSLRLEPTALFESNGAIGFPFTGIVRAAPNWQGDVENLATVAISFVAGILLVRLLFARASHLVAGSVGFVVLATMLSELVWREAFDISRGLTPVYTAFVVATFATARPDAEAEPEAPAESGGPRSGGRLGVRRERAAV